MPKQERKNTDMKTEKWLRRQYEKIMGKQFSRLHLEEAALYDAGQGENGDSYAMVSIQIKRFSFLSYYYGSFMVEKLIIHVYEAMERWLGNEEYLAHLYRGTYLALVRLPEGRNEIIKRFDQLEDVIETIKESEFKKQINCGYGVFRLEEGDDFDTAFYYAELCRTESNEQNQWASHLEFFNRKQMLNGAEWYPDIVSALGRQELQMYLQPKVDLRTGEVHAAEALIRWIDPIYGVRTPSSFLPVLEASGMTDFIDFFIFERACSVLERWEKEWGKKIRISVNLSGRIFGYPLFLNQFKEILSKYQCLPQSLEFELLESLALNQTDRVSKTVSEIRKSGFHCSLDDFGSGYSSYSVLTHTGLSAVKLDRSLFGDEQNERERLIVKHIIQTARELGMKTVAEGVETPGYVQYLKELECDYIQGYVFYKPMPEAEFENRFIRGNEKAVL